MVAPLYVLWIDVSSDYPCDWMIYYTYRKNMAAPHYGYVDVSSYFPYDWMIYYTQHRNMACPHYVHINVTVD
jgi:hypothetical protein